MRPLFILCLPEKPMFWWPLRFCHSILLGLFSALMAFLEETRRLGLIDYSDLSYWELKAVKSCVQTGECYIKEDPVFSRWRLTKECGECCFKRKLVHLSFPERIQYYKDFTYPLCIHNYYCSIEALFSDQVRGEVSTLLSHPFLQGGLAVLLYRLREFFLRHSNLLREPLCTTFYLAEVSSSQIAPLRITLWVRFLLQGTNGLDFELNHRFRLYFDHHSDTQDLHTGCSDFIMNRLQKSLDFGCSCLGKES